jgi:EVE domain-containing protein
VANYRRTPGHGESDSAQFVYWSELHETAWEASANPRGKVRYWINTVSREHVLAGVKGGFTQAGHGRQTRLKQLEKGDLIVFYSPRTELQGGETLQTFTAIGRVADDQPFQEEMSPSFQPWRRRVEFFDCREAPIQPLVVRLAFVKDKRHWGFPFRRGLFEINRTDFTYIAEAMKAPCLDKA